MHEDWRKCPSQPLSFLANGRGKGRGFEMTAWLKMKIFITYMIRKLIILKQKEN